MLWNVDRAAASPLHEQLAANVRRAVADGSVVAGERLPPARDLAGITGVNANTVLQAYRTLRAEGTVEFRRGRGVQISDTAGSQAPVTAAALELVRLGRRHGFNRAELVELITRLHEPEQA